MELNELVNEIVQGYLRKNNNGTTKTFDFEHILRKYESQSTCLFNHLKNNPSKIHYEYYVAKFYNNGYGKKISIKKGLKWLEKYREKDGSWNITDEIKKLEARKPLDIAEAINEIVEDYKKNNHTGATKNFDFKYTLEKYEPRSKDIFNQLRDNQTLIQHYEVVIGTFYKKGFGVDKDEKESFEWFSKASQKNDINGHFELGECYYNGIGIGKDCKKALYYYTLAANKGLNIALCNLAEYFMNSKNKRKAFSYYKKAAKSGFVQSQYYLARCYNNKKRNIKKSLSWLKKYQENDGSWEISDEITKVEKQLVDQVMCFFSVSLSD
ncbi:18246_t:CDS:2 [Rhizophagus irregularis]|nr:18246_t:CDS:2 [Rhizophagus irregularis]